MPAPSRWNPSTIYPTVLASPPSPPAICTDFAKRWPEPADPGRKIYMAPAAFRILDIQLFERGVVLRLPFRFGVVTLTACPQAFVKVRIRTENGREEEGAAAELLAPKWFDKNLALSNDDNFDQLRASLQLAREAYLSDHGAWPAFGHFAAHTQNLIDVAATPRLNPLLACFLPAPLYRAILGAPCRARHLSLHHAPGRNLPPTYTT